MKKHKILLVMAMIVGIFPLSTAITFAHEGHSSEADQPINQIYETQGIDDINKIDCAKVTDKQFEELGDYAMGLIHPDDKDHEEMDDMMGGEGSESLTEMHISMGKTYLGCWNNQSSSNDSGMMDGRGMMSLSDYADGDMMRDEDGDNSEFWAIHIGVTLIGIIAFVTTVMVLNKTNGKTPIEILNKRLAKGEIDKKKYEQLKKELSK